MLLFSHTKNKLHCCISGTPSKYVRSLLGDGLGAEDSRCGDAEPSHRERIRKCRFLTLLQWSVLMCDSFSSSCEPQYSHRSFCFCCTVSNACLCFAFRLNVPSIGRRKRRKMLSLKIPISSLPSFQKTSNLITQSVSWSWKICL